jgi:hypothetical protein
VTQALDKCEKAKHSWCSQLGRTNCRGAVVSGCPAPERNFAAQRRGRNQRDRHQGKALPVGGVQQKVRVAFEARVKEVPTPTDNLNEAQGLPLALLGLRSFSQ